MQMYLMYVPHNVSSLNTVGTESLSLLTADTSAPLLLAGYLEPDNMYRYYQTVAQRHGPCMYEGPRHPYLHFFAMLWVVSLFCAIMGIAGGVLRLVQSSRTKCLATHGRIVKFLVPPGNDLESPRFGISEYKQSWPGLPFCIVRHEWGPQARRQRSRTNAMLISFFYISETVEAELNFLCVIETYIYPLIGTPWCAKYFSLTKG
jgi:hypothetical protein